MRTRRRDFVIEYKSSRRQTKGHPTSIWGNLDLRAVALEVEAASGLDQPNALPSALGSENVVTTAKSAAEAEFHPLEVGEQNVSVAASETPDDNIGAALSSQQEAFEDTAANPIPFKTSPTGKASISRWRLKTNLPPAASASSTDLIVAEQAALTDELHTLETENRHLKRLMIAKLRAENARLRSMLHRFRVI